eukprot:Gb_10306 [translate_table: standard]
MALQHLRNHTLRQPKTLKLLSKIFHHQQHSWENEDNASRDAQSTPYPQELGIIDSGFSKPFSSELADDLFKLFAKGKRQRNEEELNRLGAHLTNEDVEIVLNRQKDWKTAYEFFRWAGVQYGYKHNCYTYNTMASTLAKRKQTEALKKLMGDIVNERCRMTAGALGFLIRCFGSVGLVDEAVYLFEQAGTLNCVPNTYTYNCLLEVFAKSKRYDLAEMRYNEMLGIGYKPDKFTFTALLQAYSAVGKFTEAMNLLKIMNEHLWVDEHVFTILVVALSKCGKIDQAFELLERMRKLKINPNEKTCYVLIHGFVRESRIEEALELLNLMRDLGFSPGLSIYRVLVDGLCENKEHAKAHSLYLQMTDSGLSPDLGILSKLICLLCSEDKLDTVNGLLENGLKFQSGSHVSLYNAVLEGFVEAGKVEEAFWLLQELIYSQSSLVEEIVKSPAVDSLKGDRVSIRVLTPVSPDTTSFGIVIDGLCKVGKLDRALGLLIDMARIKCVPSILIYNSLIHELCNSERLDESYKLLDEMKNRGIHPTQYTYNSILGLLCKTEKVSEALDLMGEMRLHGYAPWIKHYTLLVKKLCEHRKIIEGCNFLNKMIQLGFRPDMIAYTAAIDGLCKAGEVDHAYKLFKEMSENLYVPDVVAHNILINGFCKAGRIHDAQEILNEMLEKGHAPTVVTYNLMIDGLCKDDRVDLALLYFSKMVSEARPPNVITYTTLIDGLCNAGRPKDALIFWNEMEQKGCHPNVVSYTALIHGLCKCGKAKLALNYLHEMGNKDVEPDAFVYTVLMNSLVQEEEPMLACKVLEEMIQRKKYQNPTDKNYHVFIDGLSKLSKDDTGAVVVNGIIEKGWLPTVQNINELEGGTKKEIF